MAGFPEAPAHGAFLDPRDEWVLMWRRGLEPKAIARWCGTTPGAVRKHLELRSSLDPRLWERRLMDHDHPLLPAFVPGTRGPGVGAVARDAGRLRGGGGALAPAQHGGAGGLPGGPGGRVAPLAGGAAPPPRRSFPGAAGDARSHPRGGNWSSGRAPGDLAISRGNWQRNLQGCAAFINEHGFRPNGSTPGTRLEGRLGRWLYYQRAGLQAGRLDPCRAARLDAVLPGWRESRPVSARGQRAGHP